MSIDEYGDKFQGDIILSDEQYQALFPGYRTGRIEMEYRWPNKIVPYELCKDHSKQQNLQIELAMQKIASVSCIKFVQRTDENDYIEITVSPIDNYK